MRYKEFIEGIRMGARDLATPAAKQYTIGFEFEVAVDGFFGEDSEYTPVDAGDDSDETDAWDDFSDRWYGGNSTFDFNEWFEENYLGGRSYQINDLLKLISDNGITPRYGIVSAEDQAEFQNQKERQRLERVRQKLGDNGMFEKVTATLDKFQKDPAVFVKNIQDVVDFVHLYFILIKNDSSMSKQAIEEKVEEVVQKLGYEDLQQKIEWYYNSIKDRFSYNEASVDDFEESVKVIYTDADQSDFVELDDVNLVEDFVKYFDVNEDDLRDFTDSEWSNAENELMQQEFDTWYNRRGGKGGSKIGYVTAVVNDEFNTRASNAGSSATEWAVIEDGTAGVDAEITTPAFAINDGIAVMKKMLSIIKENRYLYTKAATGLHINIGTFTEEEAKNVDWLKFLMIMNAERVLQQFDRVHNTYAPDKLPEIISNLQDNKLKDYMNEIQTINNIVRKLSEKYSAVNLSKLVKYGIIELRAPGNKRYEDQVAYLETTVLRIVRSLELASDPNKYKKEYLTMLARRFGKELAPKKDSALDEYFINTHGFRFSKHDFLTSILASIRNNTSNNPDQGYTAQVHRELMAKMRTYLYSNSADKTAKSILASLESNDGNGVMRSSKMISLLLKELQRQAAAAQ